MKKKKAKKKDSYTRAADGKFLPGTKPGPGRPPLPIELDNLRAITQVMRPEEWKDLAMRRLRAARKGDWTSLRWLEQHSLGDATLAELHRIENQADQPPEPPPNAEQGIRALSEATIKDALLQLRGRIQAGKQLSTDESELLVKIAEVLNQAKAVDQMPDLSGVPTERLEQALLGLPASPSVGAKEEV